MGNLHKLGKKQTRCVIYTRKSSEDGLEQEFNSLHAQREACEAYIRSQAHEGWLLLNKNYDDGGFSGGNMNRPGLTELMLDIKSGEIDLILVYKVDRLSRSLADFSNMVDTFDRYDVSFVSITQQFNTSTSMGRLTLNVLLSFAQFEREVTGERIRDKIAASKKKGLWMGGYVPLGYDNIDKSLVINLEEAETVRYIYNQYLHLGTVKLLKEKLDTDGVITKQSKGGYGGNEFSRGALYALLQNPIYIGKIRHKEKLYKGSHDAILDLTTWKAVQAQISENRSAKYNRTQSKEPSLLAGLLFDIKDNPLSPAHTRKKTRRYRYYVNQALIQFKQVPDDAVTRVPANIVESLVENDVKQLLTNSSRLINELEPLDLSANKKQSAIKTARLLSEAWSDFEIYKRVEIINLVIVKITITQSSMCITYSLSNLVQQLLEHTDISCELIFHTSINIKLKRCGVETKLIVEEQNYSSALKPHPESLRAIQNAVRNGIIWNQLLLSEQAQSAKEIAACSDVSDRYVSHCIRLAFLSPSIIKRIFKGDIPHDLTLTKLKAGIPLDWNEQEKIFA